MKKVFLLIIFWTYILAAYSQNTSIEKWRVTGTPKELEEFYGKVTPLSAKEYIEGKIKEINESKDSVNIFYQTEIISLCEEYLKKYSPVGESEAWILSLNCALIERDLAYTYFKRARLKFIANDFRGASDDLSETILIARKYEAVGDEILHFTLTFRGECYYNMDDRQHACIDWREAVNLGSQVALNYVSKYCQY